MCTEPNPECHYVSQVSRDFKACKLCCAAGPAREIRISATRFLFPDPEQPGTSGLFASRVGLWEKFAPISLFAANLFSPRRSRRKFDVSSWKDKGGGYIFVSRTEYQEIWIFNRGKEISIANLFNIFFFFFFLFSFFSIKCFGWKKPLTKYS